LIFFYLDDRWTGTASGDRGGRPVPRAARPTSPRHAAAGSDDYTAGRTVLFQDGSSLRGGAPVSILGSTGSIGTQTLEIVDACPGIFVVDALSAGNNAELMADQVMRYRPRVALLSTPEAADRLRTLLRERGCADMPDIVHGPEGIVEAATVSTADTVVTGIIGVAGLLPTIEAIKLGKDIALANKETLISGGPVINPLVEKHAINMLPADSEHSAMFQCLQGVPPGGHGRIIRTASGGWRSGT